MGGATCVVDKHHNVDSEHLRMWEETKGGQIQLNPINSAIIIYEAFPIIGPIYLSPGLQCACWGQRCFVANGSVYRTDTSYVIQIHMPQTEIKDVFPTICLTGIAHVFTDEMVQTRGGTNIVLHNCNVLVTVSSQWDSPPGWCCSWIIVIQNANTSMYSCTIVAYTIGNCGPLLFGIMIWETSGCTVLLLCRHLNGTLLRVRSSSLMWTFKCYTRNI